jgi:hypothetical protein
MRPKDPGVDLWPRSRLDPSKFPPPGNLATGTWGDGRGPKPGDGGGPKPGDGGEPKPGDGREPKPGSSAAKDTVVRWLR